MRTFAKSMLAAAVAAVGIASLSLPTQALSVSLSQLLGGYTGPITLHLSGSSTGSQYGFGVTATGGYAAGAPNQAAAASNMDAVGLTTPKNGQPNEDSWGVFRIDQIQGASNQILWNEGQLTNGKHVELTGIYFGVQDVSLKDDLNGAQIIHSVGFNAVIYEQENPATPFSEATGPAGRSGVSGYPTVSDGGAVPVWTIQGTNTLHDQGIHNPATSAFEVAIKYNDLGQLTDLQGSLTGKFNTVTTGQSGAWNPLMQQAPVTVHWSLQDLPPVSFDPSPAHFDVNFKDPVAATVSSVPAPAAASAGALLLAGLVGFNAYRRRRAE